MRVELGVSNSTHLRDCVVNHLRTMMYEGSSKCIVLNCNSFVRDK
jgi:hypothetical protein